MTGPIYFGSACESERTDCKLTESLLPRKEVNDGVVRSVCPDVDVAAHIYSYLNVDPKLNSKLMRQQRI